MNSLRRLFCDFPSNTEALRRMIYYRCTHAGTKEVEILLKRWADSQLANLSREELINFHKEVLDIETPDLQNILLKKQDSPGSHYIESILSFIYNRNK